MHGNRDKMKTIKEEHDDGNMSEGSDTAYFNGDDEEFNNRDDDPEYDERELDQRFDELNNEDLDDEDHQPYSDGEDDQFIDTEEAKRIKEEFGDDDEDNDDDQ